MGWRLNWASELSCSSLIWKPPLLKWIRPNLYDIIPRPKDWLYIWPPEEQFVLVLFLFFFLVTCKWECFRQCLSLFNKWYTVMTEGTFRFPVNYQIKQPCLILVLAFKVATLLIFFNSLPKSICKVVITVASRYEEASASPHLSKGISEWDHTGIDWVSPVRLLKHCEMVSELNLINPSWVSAKFLSLVEGKVR